MTQITTPSGNTGYAHDSAGRVATRTYANNIVTSYTYDTTGRVSQMKFQDTNQQPPALLEQYDYTYSGLNASYYRQETNPADTRDYTYTFDRLRRLTQEVKRGTGQGTPLHYQKDFTYDKAGNRLSYQHQNGGGYNYGLACNYNSYTYDAMGRLTQIRDSGRSYTATVTNDWNGNITQVGEVIPGTLNATSTFTYDYENRLTEFAIGGSGFSAEHAYDGFNRLIKTDATIGQNTQNFEHVYSHDLHIGSIEVTGTPVLGKVWRWGEGYGQEAIEAPQRYTASGVQFYQVNDERNAQRKTYRVGSVTAGDYNDDSRYAEWQQVNGSVVPTRVALSTSLSELFSAYNLALDADRAASAAASSALSLAATDLEYEGTRVKSAVLGRDLNPFGRGDGRYYANGGNPVGWKFFLYDAKPPLPIARGGFGSSINNCGGSCGLGAGGGVGIDPGGFPGGYPPNQNGHGGKPISYGGSGGGGGFSSFGCNVVRNRLIGSVCPTIGSYCTHEFCKEAGQPKWAFSCFDSCTYHQCDDLLKLLWADGVEWASCEWHGGVQWDSPATVAVFAQVACGGGGVIRDCLCNGMCLDFCIQLVGGKPCYENPCDVPPEDPRPSIAFSGCTTSQCTALMASMKSICLRLGLTLPPGCEDKCLSDYQFKQCLRDICSGTRQVRFKCLRADNWYCRYFGYDRPAFTSIGWIWLCPDFFGPLPHAPLIFDSRLFHELLHWCEPGTEWEPPWGGGPVEERQERCYPGTTK